MSANASLDTIKLDLKGAKHVAVPSQEHMIELLRTGEVVVIDRKTGQFLTELLGVPLPPVERVLETVISKGTPRSDPNKIM